MTEPEDVTLEQRVHQLELDLREVREQLGDWAAYASQLSQRVERLISTLTAMSPELTHSLRRLAPENPPAH